MADLIRLAIMAYLAITLGDTAVSPGPCASLPPDEAFYLIECTHPYEWFASASIPEYLWPEFLVVAACESLLDPTNGDGDGGAAKGLFQIHWATWQPWAAGLDSAWMSAQWSDPVANARLAYFIQEEYSLPRGVPRWDRWTAQPKWPVCQQRAIQLGFNVSLNAN